MAEVVVKAYSGQVSVSTPAAGGVVVAVPSPGVAKVVHVAVAGPQGARGEQGPAAFLSADLDNRTVAGTDGGFFTPDITADPLAYYILAKA